MAAPSPAPTPSKPVLSAPPKGMPTHIFSSLVNNPEYSDLTIVCARGVELHAHQLLLRTRSEFFKNALCSPTQEQPANTVDFSADEAGVMLMILSFLYTDDYDVKEGQKMAGDNENRMTPFELHLHVALVAERLALDTLKATATNRMIKCAPGIHNWGKNTVMRVVAKFYGPTQLVDSDITQQGRYQFLQGVLDGGQIVGSTSVVSATDLHAHSSMLYQLLEHSQGRLASHTRLFGSSSNSGFK